MIYRRLSSSGDYQFGRSGQDFLSDIEAVAQAIQTRLKLLYGEWWEDVTDGLPLWQKIIGTSGSEKNRNAIDLIIKDRIQGTDHVQSVLNYSSSFDNANGRKYTFECLVVTDYGTVTVSS